MKKINITGLLLLVMLAISGCKEDNFTLTSELPQFETKEGLMLLEVIVPYGTGVNDNIFIYGDFNGGDEAIGNPEYRLQRANTMSGVPAKFGIYLNPSDFQNGKTLADGYAFFNVQSGPEVDKNGNSPVWHTEAPAVGQRQNVFVDYWETSLEAPGGDEIEHDGYAIYILNNSSWTDLYLWAWDANGNNLMGPDAKWPGMPATGTQTIDGVRYTYFDTGAENADKTVNIIISNNGSPQTPGPDPVITLDKDWYFELTAEGTLQEITDTDSVPHDGYAIFIYNNNPDFVELYAWVWDVNGGGGEDFLGVSWPGVPFTGTQMINGVPYAYFDFGSGNDGKTVNFIVNNNNQGKQAETDGLVLDKNYYYELTGTTLTEVDPNTFKPGDTPSEPEDPEEPDVPGDTYNIYVENQTGWSPLYLYSYNSAGTQFEGAWPGLSSTTTQEIAGVTYTVFNVKSDNGTVNLIFNDGIGGEGHQLGDYSLILDKDYYLKATPTGVSEVGVPQFHLYIDNQTGWDKFYVYAWSTGNPEIFGGWPGQASTETETIDGIDYLVYNIPANGLTYNLIFTNNDGVTQYDATSIVLDKDYYLTANPQSATVKE